MHVCVVIYNILQLFHYGMFELYTCSYTEGISQTIHCSAILIDSIVNMTNSAVHDMIETLVMYICNGKLMYTDYGSLAYSNTSWYQHACELTIKLILI